MTLQQPLDYSAATHPGLKRENNEDCFLSLPDAGLWVVADGMGGHEAGEVASAIVRHTFESVTHSDTNVSLTDIIQKSHQAILMSADKGIGAYGMGSTVVALFSTEKNYQIGWVGDSRAYLWNPESPSEKLTRLTTDHSYVQMLYTSGAISFAEIEDHPDKNVITQCLGMQELAEVKIDTTLGQWQKNQWILLCSDGLTDELSDSEIAEIIAQSADSYEAVDLLLQEALHKGGRDNITLQIIESPINDDQDSDYFWRWIPIVSNNRKMNVAIFFAAVSALVVLIVSMLQ